MFLPKQSSGKHYSDLLHQPAPPEITMEADDGYVFYLVKFDGHEKKFLSKFEAEIYAENLKKVMLAGGSSQLATVPVDLPVMESKAGVENTEHEMAVNNNDKPKNKTSVTFTGGGNDAAYFPKEGDIYVHPVTKKELVWKADSEGCYNWVPKVDPPLPTLGGVVPGEEIQLPAPDMPQLGEVVCINKQTGMIESATTAKVLKGYDLAVVQGYGITTAADALCAGTATVVPFPDTSLSDKLKKLRACPINGHKYADSMPAPTPKKEVPKPANTTSMQMHASKPASPEEGAIYFDTEAQQIMAFTQGQWVAFTTTVGQGPPPEVAYIEPPEPEPAPEVPQSVEGLGKEPKAERSMKF